MRLHLVDATYELFRAHFAPRPPVLGRDGIPLSGVSGLVEQLLYLLREEGATHVGCATDRVIESFRNDLYPGYKSSAGMPPELLAQFPIAEAAVEALGIVLWPMVEFEADDAIAAAAVRFGEDERVERILVCTPDKDMAQLVRDDRIVLWDRRRNLTYDDAGVRAKWGVPPTSIPDWLGLVGDTSDGFPGLPGWGAKSAAAVLTRYGHFEDIPPKASAWEVPGVGGSRAMTLAATLRDHWAEALLYRDLARLRTADDGVVIRQQRRRGASLGRRAPRASGRRSARSGAWTGWRGGRIAGWTRTEGRRSALRGPSQPEQRRVVRGGRGDDADRAGLGRNDRTTGRRLIEVTVAPPRSAISPAAATSQADSPPCWMNASNRPLATYASASAAEPMSREMRIALRTFASAGRGGPAVERQRDDEVGQLLLLGGTDRAPVEGRRAIGGRGEHLVTGRVEDDPDRRAGRRRPARSRRRTRAGRWRS